ncbi:MAG: hypothetical protein ACRENC_05210 [Gemmatimonadaceae bacterium]
MRALPRESVIKDIHCVTNGQSCTR